VNTAQRLQMWNRLRNSILTCPEFGICKQASRRRLQCVTSFLRDVFAEPTCPKFAHCGSFRTFRCTPPSSRPDKLQDKQPFESEVLLPGKLASYQLPKPRDGVQKLLDAAQVRLPAKIVPKASRVAAKAKLTARRK
jgi:hypothetical protein